MIKIIHVITGLDVGGAEIMLYKLLSRLDRNTFEPSVISLRDGGPIAERIRTLGIPVRGLAMHAAQSAPGAVMKLAAILKRGRPHIVQTWMYHADLIGGIACKMSGRALLVWNIRHGRLNAPIEKRATLLIGRVNAKLSRSLPDRIICCSEVARKEHAALGYCDRKIVVLPNGFNVSDYAPSAESSEFVRCELNIPPGALVIGHAGRFHPVKDHRGFVAAAEMLHAAMPDVVFVMCGEGVDWRNEELAAWIRHAGLESSFRLLGRRNDLPRLNAALDIATSCSTSEGFPNAVGEAMACGVPCVVTDVGDSAYLVGDTGVVVRPSDPAELFGAWMELLALTQSARTTVGERARKRVEEHFDIDNVVAQYESVYKGACTCKLRDCGSKGLICAA